jgi:hypothetical protein
LPEKGSAGAHGQMLPMTIIIRNKRVVTYRRRDIPALILEGKWLTALYRLRIGDIVDIEHKQPSEIRLRKNVQLSKERQKRLKEREELRQQRIKQLSENIYDNQARNPIAPQ